MLTKIKPGEVLTTHYNTNPHCGAAGPILYTEGRAWSVNSYEGGLTEFRFDLKYVAPGCKECERHIKKAADPMTQMERDWDDRWAEAMREDQAIRAAKKEIK